MLFNAFAAVVIGGVSLKGGIGQLPGVYAGVLLLSSIHTAINLMGLPAHYTQMILGGLVLAAVLLDTVKLPDPAEARMSGRLQDRSALVIGAARGIGAGIAERFVEEGAKVVIADREADAGAATAARLGGHFIGIDVAQKADAERAVAEALERLWPARHPGAECRHLSLDADREHRA